MSDRVTEIEKEKNSSNESKKVVYVNINASVFLSTLMLDLY